jgi:glutamyl-tRNA synthetase
MATGGKPKYDGTCRDKELSKTSEAVIRLKAPLSGTTVIEDVIKGNIVFQNDELDDFILCRSDGIPTYNYAVVIDDMTMQVNTVIRGDDHVMNTPKQIPKAASANATAPYLFPPTAIWGYCRMPCSTTWSDWAGPMVIRNFLPARS